MLKISRCLSVLLSLQVNRSPEQESFSRTVSPDERITEGKRLIILFRSNARLHLIQLAVLKEGFIQTGISDSTAGLIKKRDRIVIIAEFQLTDTLTASALRRMSFAVDRRLKIRVGVLVVTFLKHRQRLAVEG